MFLAEASADDAIVLSDGHDFYEWVTAGALGRCLPAWVADMYRGGTASWPGRLTPCGIV